MHTQRKTLLALALLVPFAVAASPAWAAITFQGALEQNGVPANGDHDFVFRLYADAGGTLFVDETSLFDVAVEEGLFTVLLSFGPEDFTGDRWLETRVRPAGAGVYTILTPLEPLTSVPFAYEALDAATLDGLGPTAFLRTIGGTVNGNVTVNGEATVSDLAVEGGSIELDAGRGLVSEQGARLETGPEGETFQLTSGATDYDIARFRNAGGAVVVRVLDSGLLFVGGTCFTPKTLLFCFKPATSDHVTWFGGACTDTEVARMKVLAEIDCPTPPG